MRSRRRKRPSRRPGHRRGRIGGPSGLRRPWGLLPWDVGSSAGSACHRRSVDFARRGRRGDDFLIIGRLHGRAARDDGDRPDAPAGRWDGPGNRRPPERLGFEHDLAQRQRRGPRRRIGGHVAPRGKARLRRNFLRPLVLDNRGERLAPYGAEVCWTRRFVLSALPPRTRWQVM